ncbi:MAG: hypothetical protein RI996_494 [Candidatus Parcubacteria bacterium]|jgi:hypothetical protein
MCYTVKYCDVCATYVQYTNSAWCNSSHSAKTCRGCQRLVAAISQTYKHISGRGVTAHILQKHVEGASDLSQLYHKLTNTYRGVV